VAMDLDECVADIYGHPLTAPTSVAFHWAPHLFEDDYLSIPNRCAASDLFPPESNKAGVDTSREPLR
jgi:hypothetical protein